MEIVVSGIAGKFPKCENLEEFKEKLLSGVELTTNNLPWKIDDERFPPRLGKIRTYKEFDAGYFGILPKQANLACPMGRMMLEAAYEAIIDAGVNPETLRDTDTGVYIGCCASESTQVMSEVIETRNASRGILTVTSSVFSGRISFWLGVTGPSIVVDTGCSSTMTALDIAYRDLMSGHCSKALVGGANMIALPYMTRFMAHDGFLSKDGRCFSFDAKANGFVRSEAVAMLFLEKAECANRVYCKIVGSKIGCEGFKEKGLLQTSGPSQILFLKQCYEECGINPLDVGYIEAHGTGTKAGDPEEAMALDAALNNGRTVPLIVGSVKSNMGHCEPVAGLSSLLKVILAMECGTVPGTLHFNTPNPDIAALIEGRLQINNKNQEFSGKYAGVSSFGLGGSLAHIVVERHDKVKQVQAKKENQLPWMVLCSGRTQEAVNYMCQQATTGGVDPELIALLHNIHSKNIKNHLYRGYSVAGNQGKTSGSACFSGEERPICFAFTGMGSQWFHMGRDLLQIPVFARSIQKSADILETKQIDLLKIITSDEPGLFDFILNSFVGIIAIQIALVDVLSDLGVKPDIIIGQSLGELSCGYADGTLTQEQTIMAAFYRGLVSVNSVFIPGAMAVVGMTSKELTDLLTEGVEIACYNGPKSQVISGQKARVQKLTKYLKNQKTLVIDVPWSSGIPYHSSYMSKPGSKFLDYLKEVIPDPKKRSDKWISSSLPESKWNTHLGSYSSAEYHFNNFCNPVLFHDAFQKVPNNAIVIEVAPHGLMESTIKQFGKTKMDYISLSDKNSPNLLYFLSAIGSIYAAGGLPQISRLYPPVSFPVSRGTKMISPLIRWDHSQQWYLPVYDDFKKIGRLMRIIDPIDFKNDEFSVNGISYYPFSKCLVDVWQTIAGMNDTTYQKLPVMFSNVVFHKLIVINDAKQMTVDIKKTTGYFEVVFDGELFISGNVTATDVEKEKVTLKAVRPRPYKYYLPLCKDDIYKELRLRGHVPADKFKLASFADFAISTAEFEWNDDWSCALECLNHLVMIQKNTRLIQTPVKCNKIILDPLKVTQGSMKKVTCYLDDLRGIISCDLIQMVGLEFNLQNPAVIYALPLLEKHVFSPHMNEQSTKYDAVHLCMHLLAENVSTTNVQIFEYLPCCDTADLLAPHIKMAFDNVPTVKCEIMSLGVKPVPGVQVITSLSQVAKKSCHLIAFNSTILAAELDLEYFLNPGGFFLISATKGDEVSIPGFAICVDHSWENGRLVMLKKKAAKGFDGKIVQLEEENDYKWLGAVQENENHAEGLLLIGNNSTSGILGTTYTLKQEMGTDKVRCVFTMDNDVVQFDANQSFYTEQLEKNLAVNVFKNGHWGSYRHVPLNSVPKEFSQLIFTPKCLLEGPLNRVSTKELISVVSSTIQNPGSNWVEYSGRDADGSRVMGYHYQPVSFLIAPSKLYPDRETLWKIPANWSLNDAAASVIPYCKALFALQFVTNISASDTILVVGADNWDGFAIISLALQMECKVYATCETASGMETLGALLPKLPAANISLQSEVGVLRNKNKAIDVILHLGKKIDTDEVNTLRQDGTILLLDDADGIRLQDLPDYVSIKRINIDQFLTDRKSRLFYAFQALLETNIPPIRSAVTTNSLVETAANTNKSGFERLVVRWRENEKIAEPQVWFDASLSYVIIGGLGGFGLELINWMVSRGATKFVVCSRSSVKTGYQSYRLRCWLTSGINIVILNEDITTENGVEAILVKAIALGPVGGIFQLALALEMGLLRNLTEDMFHRMTATRYLAAKYFDQLSRILCPELQHFVMFSSYVSGRGNMGQANYAYASSRMDRLMEIRKVEGLPALSIQWGPIGQVGALADAQETGVHGTEFQHIGSCIETLDKLLDCVEPVVASCVLQLKAAPSKHDKTVAMRISELMGIKDVSTVSQQATLAELGMDSILAVNLKTILADEFQVVLSLADIRKLTFAKCATVCE